MRKHDVRKWLHAILDLLPVIIIPVFMIYSHRHTIDTYAIDVPQNEIVEFNQIVDNPYLDEATYNPFISEGNYYYANFGNNALNLEIGHIYQVRLYVYDYSSNFRLFRLFFNSYHTDFDVPNASLVNDFQFTNDEGGSLFRVYAFDNNQVTVTWSLNVYDLTKMFGSGNEPTIDDFNTYFSQDYYDYTSGKKTLVKDVGSITYNDIDIGSQMLYCLYNSVDKYFNLNNVFGFNNVYDWLSLNIFNGNPPIAIYIVWNIALYEFLMDLIMLLYALFMWFIDMCENLIDRSFHVASGRK